VVLYYFDEFHASYSFQPDWLHDVEWHDETGEFYLITPPAAKFNPLNAKVNPICHLLALLGARHILHVSRLRVKQGRC
jgi:hypothetical protein